MIDEYNDGGDTVESFRLYNIKSFVDSKEVEVKPITVFVGKNSCGKSSLLRFPAVLSQTAKADSDSPIKFYGKMVDYGNYEDVLHHGSTEKMCFELKYKFDVNIKYSVYSRRLLVKHLMGENLNLNDNRDERELYLRVSLDKADKRLVVDQVELEIDGNCLYKIRKEKGQSYSFLANYVYKNGEFINKSNQIVIDKVHFEKFIPEYDPIDAVKSVYNTVVGTNIDDDTAKDFWKRLYDLRTEENDVFHDEERAVVDVWRQFEYYSNLMSSVFNRYENESNSIRYIGPFRETPSRIYRDPEFISYGVGVRGENLGNELLRFKRKKDSKRLKRLSEWTKRVLGYEIEVREVALGMFQIVLRDENGCVTNLIDNGYGISQVLPIATEVVRLSELVPPEEVFLDVPDKLLLIEQPELHLHPAAQSELADLFVDSILNGDGRKKILIETHSEHLIRKLQVLIASKDCPITKDMVRFYYVDKIKDEAIVEQMEVLDNGKFVNEWPTGFFDKAYLLSRELARAGIEE